MDEDISIINTGTRIERIKEFFIKNKKNLFIILSLIIFLIIGYFAYQEFDKAKKTDIADQYNLASIKFLSGKKLSVENEMINIVKKKDKTYSPLALYFLIDNNIINSQEKINNLFDILINEANLDNEIKDLIIYKKALYNSEFISESDLLKNLQPILNSDSIWKSHTLYLLGEYFLSKNEKNKAKEFFEKILNLENGNLEIKKESQKRIQRDLSE